MYITFWICPWHRNEHTHYFVGAPFSAHVYVCPWYTTTNNTSNDFSGFPRDALKCSPWKFTGYIKWFLWFPKGCTVQNVHLKWEFTGYMKWILLFHKGCIEMFTWGVQRESCNFSVKIVLVYFYCARLIAYSLLCFSWYEIKVKNSCKFLPLVDCCILIT